MGSNNHTIEDTNQVKDQPNHVHFNNSYETQKRTKNKKDTTSQIKGRNEEDLGIHSNISRDIKVVVE